MKSFRLLFEAGNVEAFVTQVQKRFLPYYKNSTAQSDKQQIKEYWDVIALLDEEQYGGVDLEAAIEEYLTNKR